MYVYRIQGARRTDPKRENDYSGGTGYTDGSNRIARREVKGRGISA